MIKSGCVEYLEKFITDNFTGWKAVVLVLLLLAGVLILVEVVRNEIKHRYDKKLEAHKSKLNQGHASPSPAAVKEPTQTQPTEFPISPNLTNTPQKGNR